jgi:hypothetical protein
MKTSVTISKKKSGNYIISHLQDKNWEVIKVCENPNTLLTEVNKLGSANVIKNEYSQSQLKTIASRFDQKDALRAFGLDTKKETVVKYFI